jgi:menaquinone-dependent protoporphyrinogen oxidase
MNILVTAASRQGSTSEIAEALAQALRERGFEVTLSAPEDVHAVDGYDAFVIGSAVYMGHWLEPATAFVDRFAAAIALRPVWLFSSGPVGDPKRKLVQKMGADPLELPTLLAHTHAREHRMLAGKLAGDNLSRPRRLSLRLFPGIEGDWRDWNEIARFGAHIADALDSEQRSGRSEPLTVGEPA